MADGIFLGGGGARSSALYQIDDVLGQWPDGLSQSDHYRIDPGFWHHGRVIRWRRFLPLVVTAGTEIKGKDGRYHQSRLVRQDMADGCDHDPDYYVWAHQGYGDIVVRNIVAAKGGQVGK